MRGEGIAVYMAQDPTMAPFALVNLLRHSWFLHEVGILLSVHIEEIAIVSEENRVTVEPMAAGFYRVVMNFGYTEDPNIARVLESLQFGDVPFRMEEAVFFTGKMSFMLSGSAVDMQQWRLRFFLALAHLAEHAPSFFNLPSRQVITIGSDHVL